MRDTDDQFWFSSNRNDDEGDGGGSICFSCCFVSVMLFKD